MKVEKDYTYLQAPDDRYELEDDEGLLEPPSPELILRLWRSVREGPAAFNAFISTALRGSQDKVLLLYSLDARGQNFLHTAAEVGDVQTLDLLPGKMFLNRHRETPEHLAVREELPWQRDMDGNRPLHIAARNDNLEFVKALIQWHAWGYVDDSDLSIEPRPMFGRVGCYIVSRTELRYKFPLLDFRNKAGRTAAQEAWHAGALGTARWLDAYKRQYVGDENDLRDEGESDDGLDVDQDFSDAGVVGLEDNADVHDGERFLSNRCTVM